MDMHIGYDNVTPSNLERTDVRDKKSRKAGLNPKVFMKAYKSEGRIAIDSETTLSNVPIEGWNYKIANRSALDWFLEQYKEKRPKDPTIREYFTTYRFADYKDNVIDLLKRVTTVSVVRSLSLKQ